MNITTFFSSLETVSVGVLSAQEYQPLFCQAFLKHVEAKLSLEKTVIAVDELQWSSVESTLRMTFLGQKKLMWLGSTQDYDVTTKKKLAALLATYDGPHLVWLFVTQKDAALFETLKEKTIDLENVTAAEKTTLSAALYGSQTMTVFGNKASLSWDQQHIMQGYAAVVGRNGQQFMDEWYEKIVLPESSLFTLAQAFFARRPHDFFPLWNRVKNEYAGVFWTSFWSDQIWRAYYVIALRQQQKVSQAQQLSFRLPFSFLQHDWKNISLDELQRAHQFLYEADYALKNGASEECIDIFCTEFVLKKNK